MPIAAVPNYLGKDFSQASPGQRFGMYLPLWGVNQRTQQLLWETHDITYEVRGQRAEEREVKKENKVTALEQATVLNAADKKLNKALLTKQFQAFATVAETDGLCLHAEATAPFTTGLGNEHPLENGFAFLNPYGLPYLPGSGVKGVLRQAANELASGQWGDSDWGHSKDNNKRHEVLDRQGKHLFDASDIDVLFGSMAEQGEDHLRGVLSFWDVIPQIKGERLMVEIMTPHQSHYYQGESGKKTGGSASPHDSGSPIPISFLTVPPGSNFAFHVVCDCAQLARLAPDLATSDRWKTMLTEAFEHAFAWMGFGAKTAVGYGAFERNTKAEKILAEQQAKTLTQAAQQAKLASMSPQQQLIEAFVQACQRKVEVMGTNSKKEKPNAEMHAKARALAKAALEGQEWTADEKRACADALTAWLPQVAEVDMKDERKKLKLAALRGEA
jgi:CRISPR-associated protein Cmr6